ncbi:hypothetical protein DVH24_030984 [Malus domestica]|uniref:Uncharacterized protein n=1 Tax=Malus domestica TaxID=3750 RepID=A0A498HHQ0_MALDO|nr:hypothetical protein DVH24_030984 [Malus domestica]
MMMNDDGFHSGHELFTRRVARELQMKEEEIRWRRKEKGRGKEEKEEAHEGVEAKEPSFTESPDQTVDGVNAGAAQDVPAGPLPSALLPIVMK